MFQNGLTFVETEVEKWISDCTNSRIYVSTELITFTSEMQIASLFCWDLMLHIYEKAWTVQQETSVKSLKKCGIINALVGTEGDVLFEGSESSELTTVIIVRKSSGDGMTSMNFTLHYHFAKCFEFELYM